MLEQKFNHILHTTYSNLVVTVLSIVLTAGITWYFQIRSVRKQQKLQLFEKRLSFYLELRELFNSVYETGKLIDNHDLAKYERKARFMFGKDISRLVSNFNNEYNKSKSYFSYEKFDKHFDKYMKL